MRLTSTMNSTAPDCRLTQLTWSNEKLSHLQHSTSLTNLCSIIKIKSMFLQHLCVHYPGAPLCIGSAVVKFKGFFLLEEPIPPLSIQSEGTPKLQQKNHSNIMASFCFCPIGLYMDLIWDIYPNYSRVYQYPRTDTMSCQCIYNCTILDNCY